jgi:hypothetical protein
MVRIKTNTAYTQAAGCFFCLHVGSVAIYFGSSGPGHRLELFTPEQRFRLVVVGQRLHIYGGR